jgi:hypothetical protein
VLHQRVIDDGDAFVCAGHLGCLMLVKNSPASYSPGACRGECEAAIHALFASASVGADQRRLQNRFPPMPDWF